MVSQNYFDQSIPASIPSSSALWRQ